MVNMDVFLWAGDDTSGASLALSALKTRLKAPVGQWFYVGVKNDKLERLAYDLGARALVQPADLTGFAPLAAAQGEAPVILCWSAEAVLVADWSPWQGENLKLWETCPAAFLRRTDLTGATVASWEALRSFSTLSVLPLPASQVKTVAGDEFEKITHGSPGFFGPSVVLQERKPTRR